MLGLTKMIMPSRAPLALTLALALALALTLTLTLTLIPLVNTPKRFMPNRAKTSISRVRSWLKQKIDMIALHTLLTSDCGRDRKGSYFLT